MERAEKIGLGVAAAGHVLLFGLLSVGFLDTPNPVKLKQNPVEVSLVKDVALEAAAPAAAEAPSQAVAPDVGEPEEAPPPAEAPPEPVPAPVPEPAPAPRPQPAPPKPAPPKPAPPKPAPPKPAPAPKPVPKPQPKPRPKPAPAAEKAPAKPAPAKQPSASSSSSKAKTPPAASKGSGKTEKATAAKPRGSRLGNDFLKGLTAEKTSARESDAPPAARVDGKALAAIQQAIARQIQPCADRQVDPGPGANQIVTALNLRLNRDGTLSATPTVVRQAGVNDDNRRYARRVVDLGIAAFKGCSPLKLPAEYYSTANGGWSNINYNWKLR